LIGDRKVAIVTGGARGIGRGCALRLAASGCDIVLIDLLEPEMKSTSAEISKLGADCIDFVADVSDHKASADIAKQVYAHFGRLDILVIMLVNQCRWALGKSQKTNGIKRLI